MEEILNQESKANNSIKGEKLVNFLKWWLVIFGGIGIALIIYNQSQNFLGNSSNEFIKNLGILSWLSILLGFVMQLSKLIGGIELFRGSSRGGILGAVAYSLSVINNLSIFFAGKIFSNEYQTSLGALAPIFIVLVIVFLSTIDVLFIILNILAYRRLKTVP